MRRFLVLLLITATVWAQTDFDKLVPVLDYENLSIKGKVFYDAQKNQENGFYIPQQPFRSLSLQYMVLK